MATCERHVYFSSTIGITALQAPFTAPPCSTTSDRSPFTQSGDEPLIYASLWSNRVPFTFQIQPEGSTSSKRLRAHSMVVGQQAKSQTSALSEATGTTHDPSALISPASRGTSYPSNGSPHSKDPTINGSERPLSPTTPNETPFRTVMGPGERDASTTDRIMAACAPDIAALWKDPAVRNILSDFFGIQMDCEAGL